ncbi:MAG: beta strand repeat-containing protein, partial [Gemmatimonadales bacterium]
GFGTNPGGASLTGSFATAVGGVATFGSLILDKAAPGYMLAASTPSPGVAGAVSGAFAVNADGVSAAQSAVGVSPATIAASAGASVSTVTVTVRDDFGNPVSGATVVLAATGNGNTITQPTLPTGTNGQATGTLSSTASGLKTVSATANGLAIAQTQIVTVDPAAADSLAANSLVAQSGTAGADVASPPSVLVTDAFGNPVPSVPVTFTLTGGGGSISPASPAAIATGPNGVAVLTSWTLGPVVGSNTVSAASGTLRGSPVGFTATSSAGTATQLVFTQEPSDVVAGGTILPAVTVEVRDGSGNPVTSYSTGVSLALSNNPSGANLTGGGAVIPVNGIATFTGLSLDKAGTGYTLIATSGGLNRTSAGFDVTAGTATQLVFTQQPSNVVAGADIAPPVTVTAEDAIGNPVTGYSTPVSLALGNNPGSATLVGGGAVTPVNGVATFPGLQVNKTGVNYTLDATSAGLNQTSAGFTVSAGTATQLVFTQPPSDLVAGGTIAPAVTVEVRDGNGNPVTSYSTGVSLALGNNPGGATLLGGGAVTPVNGVATFAGLSLDKVGANYTLVASSGGLNQTSTGFSVTAGAATQLVFTQQPGNVVVGVAIAPAVTVEVRDANGNPVPTYSTGVSLALGNNPGSATLLGGGTVTPVNGVATFSGLSLNKSGLSYTLVATSGALNQTSAGFNVTAAAATQLVFSQQPSNTVAGGTISPAITVAVRDGNGNLVDTATTSISIAIGNNPASGVLSGTFSKNAAGGVATFGNLSINAAGPGYTLTANGGGLVPDTSAGFDIDVGTGNRLAFVVQPNNAVTGGAIAPAVTVAIQDGSGNTVTTATDAVTIVLGTNPSGGSLSGGAAANAVNGIATFSNLRIDRTGTGYTLTALASGLFSATSTGFNLTQAATTTGIASDLPDPSVVGQPVTVTYSVAVTAPGSGSPTGSVTVSDGAASCLGTVAAASCALTSTTAGAKTLTATYAGDGNFSGSVSAGAAHTVNAASTTTAITSDTPDPSTVGQAYTVSFTVTSTGGTPTGNVTVSDGAASCLGTVAAGSCALTSTTAGAKTLTASYAGDGNFAASVSAGAAHTVNAASTTTTILSDTPDPSTVGQAYTVSFTVTSTGGTPTGNVTVSDGVASCLGTVAAGSCALTSTTAGAKTLTASYAGDGNFAASVSGGAAHTVNAAGTTTTIVSDTPDPTAVGQAYTVSFTVTSSGGTPTGNVTVSDGTDSCLGTVAAGSCALTSTTAGAKTLTASYAGDGNFTASVSAGAAHTVTAASTTTTILSDTPDPSTVGQAYTVSFSVTSTGGTPTGNVTVSDGTDSCVGTVASGSCALTSTTAGAKTLTATYAGDANFNGSVSAGAAHTVNGAGTTTALTSDTPDPSTVGQAYTVSFTVTSTGGTPTGNVTVSDGAASCLGTVAAGNCALTSTTAGAMT